MQSLCINFSNSSPIRKMKSNNPKMEGTVTEDLEELRLRLDKILDKMDSLPT